MVIRYCGTCLLCRCLGMDVFSGSAVLAFICPVTVCSGSVQTAWYYNLEDHTLLCCIFTCSSFLYSVAVNMP
jgi:hypothetical protein